jgi:hypothetical protein
VEKATVVFLDDFLAKSNLPCFDSILEEDYMISQQIAIKEYKKDAVGSEKDKILEKLLEILTFKFQERQSLNKQLTEKNLKVFLDEAFKKLDQEVKFYRIKSYADYDIFFEEVLEDYLNDIRNKKDEFEGSDEVIE